MLTPKRLKFAALAVAVVLAATVSPTLAQQAGTFKGATPAPPRTKGTTPAAKPAAPAASEPPPKPKVDPAAVAQMQKLMQAWEQQSAKIKTLTVKYKRYDHSPLFTEDRVYEGQAKLKSGDPETGTPNQAYLEFNEVVDGKLKLDERIYSDGKAVYQFRGPTKQVFIFPLAKDQRQKTLEEGPLPFLFNMKADKAAQRYDMSLIDQTADTYTIRIIPLLQIDRDEYSQAMVILDKLKFLPQAIKLWSPNGKETKRFAFKPEDLATNVKIDPAWFDAQNAVYGPKGAAALKWKIVVNPDANGNPQDPKAPPGRPAAQPAMKGAPELRK